MPQKTAIQGLRHRGMSPETSHQLHRETPEIQRQVRMGPAHPTPIRQVYTNPQARKGQARNQPDLDPQPQTDPPANAGCPRGSQITNCLESMENHLTLSARTTCYALKT